MHANLKINNIMLDVRPDTKHQRWIQEEPIRLCPPIQFGYGLWPSLQRRKRFGSLQVRSIMYQFVESRRPSRCLRVLCPLEGVQPNHASSRRVAVRRDKRKTKQRSLLLHENVQL